MTAALQSSHWDSHLSHIFFQVCPFRCFCSFHVTSHVTRQSAAMWPVMWPALWAVMCIDSLQLFGQSCNQPWGQSCDQPCDQSCAWTAMWPAMCTDSLLSCDQPCDQSYARTDYCHVTSHVISHVHGQPAAILMVTSFLHLTNPQANWIGCHWNIYPKLSECLSCFKWNSVAVCFSYQNILEVIELQLRMLFTVSHGLS